MKRFSFLIILVLFFIFNISHAQIPRIINYQGVLLGQDEAPVAEGDYKLTFSLYDEADNLAWTEVHTKVYVAGGMFHVLLGTVTHLGIPFDKPYLLGIQVGNDPELEPRMMMTSACYSFSADNANTVAGIEASTTPQPNTLLALDNNGKFPSAVLSGGSVSGNYLKKNEPDTSRGNYASPLLLISNLGASDGINGRSVNGAGIAGRSEKNDGVTGWTGTIGKSGVFGFSVNGKGVGGRSDNEDGVAGWTGSSDKSGVFGHSDNGSGVTGRSDKKNGVFGASKNSFGGFFRSDNDHFDLALGGPIGRINTDPDIPNSNLILSSNNDVTIRLDNNGGGNGIFEIKNSGGNNVCTVNEEGTMALYSETSKIIELGKGLDYAEGFDVTCENNISAGTVLIIDADNPGKLAVSNKQYDNKIAGIVAGANGLGSGVRLGAGQFDCDVALAGRVYCKVDGSYGEVTPGALLTTSPTSGYAMVVKDFSKAQGAILGKAMEKLPQGTKSQILVLVTLQ